MIIAIFGDPGNCKTLLAVGHYIYPYYLKGYTIYSNLWLSFPHKRISLQFLLDVVEGKATLDPKSAIIFDELTTAYDSRSSGSGKIQMIASYLFLQHRKYNENCDLPLVYTAQWPKLVDIRAYEVADKKVIVQKLFPIEELPEYKFPIIALVREETQSITGNTLNEFIFVGDPFAFMYNTREIIRPEHFERYGKKK